MPPFILSLLIKFKTQIIVAIAILGLLASVYAWHLSIVSSAEKARDIYWTNYIKSAPRDTIKIFVSLPTPPPQIIVKKDTVVDSATLTAAQIKLDSLAQENSAIKAFLSPFSATFTDNLKWAEHKITANPRTRELQDNLSYNPASIPSIQINQLVPIPYDKWGISASSNIVGQVSFGLSYRVQDSWTIGADYQALGPVNATKPYERVQIQIMRHF